MSSFVKSLKRTGAIVGVSGPLSRALSVVGDEPKPDAIVKARPATFRDFLAQVREEAPQDVEDGAGTVVGAVAGAVLWPEHRVLGALGGASLGRNIPALFKDGERTIALTNMSATGGGIVGSLLWRAHPVWGFLLGHAAVNVVTHFAGWRRAA